MTLGAMARFSGIAVIGLAVFGHGRSYAATVPLTVTLDYSAAPECPAEADFKSIVAGRLGYDAFREGESDRVLVEITPRSPAYEGRIEWRNAEGRWQGDRSFPSRSNDCNELARAMAFALALQIQFSAIDSASPDQQPTLPPPESGKTTETPAPTPVPRVQESAPAVPEKTALPTARPRPTVQIGAGALLGHGLDSEALPIARIFGGLAWRYLSLELAAEVGWPTTTRRADGAGFSQQLLLGGVAGCGTLRSWSACLVAKAGAIRIVGKDIDLPAGRSGPILETGLRLDFTQPLGRRIYLALRAEGLLNVTRWIVTLDQLPVWTAPCLAETIALDFGIRFP
jgi:hypothetical protein